MSTLHDKTGLTIAQATRAIPRLRSLNADLLAALEPARVAPNLER